MARDGGPHEGLMPRIFLGLALGNAALLATACAVGRLGPLALVTTAFVHAAAFAYLHATRRRVAVVALGRGLPEWVEAQARKNERKASRFAPWGVLLAAFAAWPGGWHAATAPLALGFNLGAFLAECAVIAAQARLARDVEAHAGARARPREAVAGAEAVAR
jgi:hypothetical protein